MRLCQGQGMGSIPGPVGHRGSPRPRRAVYFGVFAAAILLSCWTATDASFAALPLDAAQNVKQQAAASSSARRGRGEAEPVAAPVDKAVVKTVKQVPAPAPKETLAGAGKVVEQTQPQIQKTIEQAPAQIQKTVEQTQAQIQKTVEQIQKTVDRSRRRSRRPLSRPRRRFRRPSEQAPAPDPRPDPAPDPEHCGRSLRASSKRRSRGWDRASRTPPDAPRNSLPSSGTQNSEHRRTDPGRSGAVPDRDRRRACGSESAVGRPRRHDRRSVVRRNRAGRRWRQHGTPRPSCVRVARRAGEPAAQRGSWLRRRSRAAPRLRAAPPASITVPVSLVTKSSAETWRALGSIGSAGATVPGARRFRGSATRPVDSRTARAESAGARLRLLLCLPPLRVFRGARPLLGGDPNVIYGPAASRRRRSPALRPPPRATWIATAPCWLSTGHRASSGAHDRF